MYNVMSFSGYNTKKKLNQSKEYHYEKTIWNLLSLDVDFYVKVLHIRFC